MVFEEGPTKVMITPKVFYSTQKRSFSLRIFPVNVAKSAVRCGFGNTY